MRNNHAEVVVQAAQAHTRSMRVTIVSHVNRAILCTLVYWITALLRYVLNSRILELEVM